MRVIDRKSTQKDAHEDLQSSFFYYYFGGGLPFFKALSKANERWWEIEQGRRKLGGWQLQGMNMVLKCHCHIRAAYQGNLSLWMRSHQNAVNSTTVQAIFYKKNKLELEFTLYDV